MSSRPLFHYSFVFFGLEQRFPYTDEQVGVWRSFSSCMNLNDTLSVKYYEAEIQYTDTTYEQLLQHSQCFSQPEFDIDVLQTVSWFKALQTLTSLAIDC